MPSSKLAGPSTIVTIAFEAAVGAAMLSAGMTAAAVVAPAKRIGHIARGIRVASSTIYHRPDHHPTFIAAMVTVRVPIKGTRAPSICGGSTNAAQDTLPTTLARGRSARAPGCMRILSLCLLRRRFRDSIAALDQAASSGCQCSALQTSQVTQP
jgi:hypothetical protein